MNSNRDEIKDVLGKFEAGQIDRRSFVQSLGLLGVSTFVANAVIQSPLGATKAFAAIGGPEERAWTLAKEAAAKATKKTLTVLIPTGSIGNMTPYVDKWKNELVIQLVFIEEPDEVVHTKGMQEAVAKTGSYDVMMPTAMSYPDWIESGVIYDLTWPALRRRPDHCAVSRRSPQKSRQDEGFRRQAWLSAGRSQDLDGVFQTRAIYA